MVQVKATKNAFDSKEDLKANGFVWDKENKVWSRDFATMNEYNQFMDHFMNTTYYGRKVVNRYHSQVVFEVVEVAEENVAEEQENEVLNMLKEMNGCYTAVYTADNQGYNSAYSAYNVDWLLDEDNAECLMHDDWYMTGFEKATPENVDIDEWAQEFDRKTIDTFKAQLADGDLFVAHYENDDLGSISILIWQ